MAAPKVTKRRIVTSIHNLPAEIQDQVKAHYPTGYTDAMMRIDKPNGDFFYAVSYSIDEIDYLVKIDVKIDDKRADDDDKELFDDDIKESEEAAEPMESDEDDDL